MADSRLDYIECVCKTQYQRRDIREEKQYTGNMLGPGHKILHLLNDIHNIELTPEVTVICQNQLHFSLNTCNRLFWLMTCHMIPFPVLIKWTQSLPIPINLQIRQQKGQMRWYIEDKFFFNKTTILRNVLFQFDPFLVDIR